MRRVERRDTNPPSVSYLRALAKAGRAGSDGGGEATARLLASVVVLLVLVKLV